MAGSSTGTSKKEPTDIIQCFEYKTNVAVPVYLRNLLVIAGYDNHLTIKNFNLTDDFNELEKIARTTIPLIVDKQNLAKYLGPFEKDPECFFILPGHKCLIKELKKFAETYVPKRIFLFDHEQTGTKKKRATSSRMSSNTKVTQQSQPFNIPDQNKSENLSENTEENTLQQAKVPVNVQEENSRLLTKTKENTLQQANVPVNVQEEKSRLLARITFWIKQFLRGLNIYDEQELEFSNKIEAKTEITNFEVESPHCLVVCFLCQKLVKIYRTRQRTWLISNIQKHIRTHSDILKKTTTKKPLYNSLLNFVTIDKPAIPNNNQIIIESNSLNSSASGPIEGSTVDGQFCQNNYYESNAPDSALELLSQPETELEPILIQNDSLISKNPPCYTPVQTSNSCIIIHSDIRCNVPEEVDAISEDISKATCSSDSVSQVSLNKDFSNNSTQNFGKSTRVNSIKGDDQSRDSNCLSECVTVLKSPSKWKQERYSRPQRNIRLLDRSIEKSSSNHLITDYFELITKLENELIKTFQINPEIKKISSECGEGFNCTLNEHNIPHFLKALQENIIKTKGHQEGRHHGRRYEKDFKNMCTYLYMIGGPLLYETLYLNLGGLPSVKTVKRIIQDEQIHEEGVFRFNYLKKFLIKRNYPLQVWISEDQTAITNKIEYFAKTNTVVGFVPHLNKDGLPEVNSFKFETLNDLQQYFEKESKSTYINLIIAQPLVDKSPSFCLCVYGTANKFNSTDVKKRWAKIRKMAEKENISIVGFSTDGDTRMLKTMKENMCLPSLNSENENNWFFANQTFKEPFYIQDTVHIGTKLKTAFLKPGTVLPIGTYFISSKDLHTLIEKVSKDKHNLTESTLTPNDKMNFDSVEKITDSQVISQLLQHVQDSKGTAIFLNMCRHILDSFLEKRLSPLERIHKMWVATFFFRIWRHHIKENKNFSMTNNFISLNCYTCIEVNAHSMISYIKKCREENNEQMFLPWLLSSQPCEENFRKLRSMTTTFSTIVNFSLLDVLRRLNRLTFMCEVAKDTENYSFARNQNRRLGDNTATETATNEHKMPSDEKIEEEIRKAWLSASLLCISLNVPVSDVTQPSINYLLLNENKEPSEEPSVEQSEEEIENDNEEDLLPRNDSQRQDCEIIIPEECLQDSSLNILSDCYASQGTLNLKDYHSKSEGLSSDSPYLKVQLKSGKCVTTRKSSLCWLFQTDRAKLSNDRLLRVRGVESKSQTKASLEILKQKYIKLGNWCVFTENNSNYVGQVIGFFVKESKILKPINETIINITNKNISCLATWYTINEHNILEIVDNKSYINVGQYKYTILEPEFKDSCYKLTNTILYKLKETVSKKVSQNKKQSKRSSQKRKLEILETSASDSSSDESSSRSSSKEYVRDSSSDNLNFSSSDSDNSNPDVNSSTIRIKEEQYYAVYYDDGWYIGRIIEVGNQQLKVKFLKSSLEEFVWPKTPDIQSIDKDFIIYGPINLLGNYPFKLKRTEKLLIEQKFKMMKKLQ